MSKEVKVRGYEYLELSDRAKYTAMEEVGIPELATDDVRLFFKDELEYRGFPHLKAWFSLNYCQGDGVAFEGKVYAPEVRCEDFRKILARYPRLEPDDLTLVLTNGSRYTHWNSFQVELNWDALPGDLYEEQLAEFRGFESEAEEYFRNLSQEFERLGYEIIEERESDQEVAEHCRINGYLFHSDGRFLTDQAP